MRKQQLIIGVIGFFILVLGFVFITKDKSDNAMVEKKQDREASTTMAAKDSSAYVEYSKEAFEQSAQNRRVLFFYANWCPTCREADPDFKAHIDKIPQDVTVIRVNYNDTDTDNEEKELAKKYGITYQHTFVQIDGAGKEVKKWNGGKTDELVSTIQ